MEIGKTIKKYREAIGVTQEVMAKHLELNISDINSWEKGNAFPDISLLSSIAEILHISTDTLLNHNYNNFEHKRKQAMIFSNSGQFGNAYKTYEELLYEGYQHISMTLNGIVILALEEKNFDKASMIIKKAQGLAKLFEFGQYHEVSPALELATLEKDVDKTLEIIEQMLGNIESIYAFTKSPLYSNMSFSEPKKEYIEQIRENLLKLFRDQETYSYMKDSKRWKDLVD